MRKYDIYTCNLMPDHATEAGKVRPVVVISDWSKGAYVAVIPIGSNSDKEGLFRIGVDRSDGLKKKSWILVDQIRAVHRSRLEKKAGQLGSDKSQRLDQGIQLFLGLF